MYVLLLIGCNLAFLIAKKRLKNLTVYTGNVKHW